MQWRLGLSRNAAAVAAAAAAWSLKWTSRRALPWPLGRWGVAWVMRVEVQHKNEARAGKSIVGRQVNIPVLHQNNWKSFGSWVSPSGSRELKVVQPGN